jgi:hypothetical protein
MNTVKREINHGTLMILDAGFQNSCKVKVVNQTPQFLYTTVEDEDGDQWTVMTYRLSDLAIERKTN